MTLTVSSSRGRILVVEDDREIMEIIRRYLEEDGYEVLLAADGHAALQKAREERVELVVLDLMIPGPDGLEVTRRLRATSPIPILIVSARAEGSDRITGLELGADDYLTKPFLPRELLARVKALLRRSRLPSLTSLQTGGIVLDLEARRVKMQGEAVELTPLEYELLKLMMGAPGKNFSREELLDRVWGPEYLGDTRRVDLHISKLRAKLTIPNMPSPIRSVWGVGYRYEA